MLATDLTLDSTIAIAVGTQGAQVFSQLWPATDSGGLVRSVASLATSTPRTLRIAHSQRVKKGMKAASNISIPAPNLIFDRHLIRLDQNVLSGGLLYDPNYEVNYSLGLTIEVPRLGASTPTAVTIMNALKQIVQTLDASTQANLTRILNGES